MTFEKTRLSKLITAILACGVDYVNGSTRVDNVLVMFVVLMVLVVLKVLVQMVVLGELVMVLVVLLMF